MSETTLNWDKPLVAINGCSARRVACLNKRESRHLVIITHPDGTETSEEYQDDGRLNSACSAFDLVNLPPPVQTNEFFVNCYSTMAPCVHDGPTDAKLARAGSQACVRTARVKVTFDPATSRLSFEEVLP